MSVRKRMPAYKLISLKYTNKKENTNSINYKIIAPLPEKSLCQYQVVFYFEVWFQKFFLKKGVYYSLVIK